MWMGTKSCKFIVKSFYLVDKSDCFNPSSYGLWLQIWNSIALERNKVFMWQLAFNALPTRQLLNLRLGNIETCCFLWGEEKKTLMHLFKRCLIACRIVFACKWSLKLDAFAKKNNNCHDWVNTCLNALISGDVVRRK